MRRKAIAVLRDHLGVDDDITSATTLDDLNADSLDRIEAGMALEDQFGVTIPDTVIEKWTTVADVLDWLERHQPQPRDH
jgi:acyl carrier protein